MCSSDLYFESRMDVIRLARYCKVLDSIKIILFTAPDEKERKHISLKWREAEIRVRMDGDKMCIRDRQICTHGAHSFTLMILSRRKRSCFIISIILSLVLTFHNILTSSVTDVYKRQQWNGERFIHWAGKVGSNTQVVVRAILGSYKAKNSLFGIYSVFKYFLGRISSNRVKEMQAELLRACLLYTSLIYTTS